MGTSFFDDMTKSILGLVVLGLIIVLAIVVTPFLLVGVPLYIGFRLWRESPARLERLARVETDFLYQHALAGTAHLSAEEVEAELARSWPSDLPSAVTAQLLAIGRSLFEREGLSPDIPPPPALCNTVEGGRYRDLLARAGQARNDRAMIQSALRTIGNALAPVA